jgi:hypothetical protein
MDRKKIEEKNTTRVIKNKSRTRYATGLPEKKRIPKKSEPDLHGYLICFFTHGGK